MMKMPSKSWLVKTQIILISLVLLALPAFSQVISTTSGPVEGIINGNVYQFLGIPYAQPPVVTETDTLRWKPPVAHKGWTEIFMADEFGHVCPQKKFEQSDTINFTIQGDENCLTLNIWTPTISEPTLPVMVFIHGGGNQQGSASEEYGGTQMFFGKNMAERGNVVLVTIQYRLGLLGYVVHPGIEAGNELNLSGNFAVLDQIMALQWIKDNIAAFGGDSENVTIFGESAGGLNVGNLMVSPQATGLFHKAIIQSAVPVINDYNDSRQKGIEWVNKFVPDGTDTQKIAALNGLDADSLLYFETSPLSGGAVQMNWQPVLDNHVFTQMPVDAFKTGNYQQVPLIIGTNADEMSLSAPATIFPFMVRALINTRLPEEYRAQAELLYPPGSDEVVARQSYVQLLSDVQFTSPARRVAQCVSKNQTQPVWRYLFSHAHTVPILEPYGSYHGMELFYVFNNWENHPLGSGIFFKPEDASVQDQMLQYWTNFVRSGNPNGDDLIQWPQYDAETDCYMEISATPNGTQCGLKTEKSDLWDAVAGFEGCTSSLGIPESKPSKWLVVYPNPVTDVLYLEGVNTQNFSIEIFDIAGRCVSAIENQQSVDVSELPEGVYIISVFDNQTVRRGKFVKRTI
jgi:para-nitrobenzyl esterase